MQHNIPDGAETPRRLRFLRLGALTPFWRTQAPVGHFDRARACLGAFLGLLLTGLVGYWWLGPSPILPALIAPMGASAVLLFAVPASPLAQPWAIVGGNILSALIGIACAKMIGAPLPAAAVAVALAIGAMSLARCLHPPGGAIALTAVIGGPAIQATGWSFALVPVGLNSLILMVTAILFHRLSGRTYPHHAPPVADTNRHGTADIPPQDRIGYNRADIDDVLAHYHDLLDVSRDDLAALFRQIEVRAHRRLHGEIRCDQIMSRDIIVVHEEESIDQARDRLLAHRLTVMPVVNARGLVLGVARHIELLGSRGRTVGDVMDRAPCMTQADTPIDELLPILSGGRHHEAIVMDAAGQLAGIITQTDLLAALWRSHVAEQFFSAGHEKREQESAAN